MALSLDVHVGDWFYLNAASVTVRSFAGYYAATVEVNGKTFHLTDEAVEIYPQVQVRCVGPQSGKLEGHRAVHQFEIDAPLSIRIPMVMRQAAKSAKASFTARFGRSSHRGVRAHQAVSRRALFR